MANRQIRRCLFGLRIGFPANFYPACIRGNDERSESDVIRMASENSISTRAVRYASVGGCTRTGQRQDDGFLSRESRSEERDAMGASGPGQRSSLRFSVAGVGESVLDLHSCDSHCSPAESDALPAPSASNSRWVPSVDTKTPSVGAAARNSPTHVGYIGNVIAR